MSILTENKQKEKESRIEFERIVDPWDCMRPEHDTNVDLFVQPYFGLQEKGAKQALSKRFLVQLKSTSKVKFLSKDRTASISIEVHYLKSWFDQKDPVMIARYSVNSRKFYYVWVDQIKIKDQKHQTVLLPYILEFENREVQKDQIIKHVLPPIINRYDFLPSINNRDNNSSTIETKWIKGYEKLDLETFDPLLTELKNRHFLNEQIFTLRKLVLQNPKDELNRLRLSILYLKINDLASARIELHYLITEIHSTIAIIFNKLISNGKEFQITNANSYKLRAYYEIDVEKYPEEKIAFRFITQTKTSEYLILESDIILVPEEFFPGKNKIEFKYIEGSGKNPGIKIKHLVFKIALEIDDKNILYEDSLVIGMDGNVKN